jgi:hypothetical protein
MASKPLARIKRLVEEGRYEISNHALDEAMEDDLHRLDIESGILTGRLQRVQKGDRRGLKYVIVGRATDLQRRLGVVVRFKSEHLCAIITVYEIQEG